MENNLLQAIGRNFNSTEVRDVILSYSLNEVNDDPPFRRYVGSRSKGLDLLVENERIIALQVFVQPLQGFAEFPNELPFGLQQHMNQNQVHQLLGRPLNSDEFDSKYTFPADNLKLVINFDDSSRMTYLNVGILRK